MSPLLFRVTPSLPRSLATICFPKYRELTLLRESVEVSSGTLLQWHHFVTELLCVLKILPAVCLRQILTLEGLRSIEYYAPLFGSAAMIAHKQAPERRHIRRHCAG